MLRSVHVLVSGGVRSIYAEIPEISLVVSDSSSSAQPFSPALSLFSHTCIHSAALSFSRSPTLYLSQTLRLNCSFRAIDSSTLLVTMARSLSATPTHTQLFFLPLTEAPYLTFFITHISLCLCSSDKRVTWWRYTHTAHTHTRTDAEAVQISINTQL